MKTEHDLPQDSALNKTVVSKSAFSIYTIKNWLNTNSDCKEQYNALKIINKKLKGHER